LPFVVNAQLLLSLILLLLLNAGDLMLLKIADAAGVADND